MKKMIFLLCISFLVFTKANCSEFDQIKNHFAKVVTINEFRALTKTKIPETSVRQFYELLSRNLDFNYVQNIFDVEINQGIDYCQTYRVFIVSVNDTICLANIQQIDNYDRILESSNFIEKDPLIHNYLKMHKSIYNIDITNSEFVYEFTRLTIFGFNCYSNNMYFPVEIGSLINFIDFKKYESLSKWIRSVTPELQAYGLVGLLHLKNSGMEIKPEEVVIIDYIKNRNSDVFSCAGCTYGMTVKMKDIISREESKYLTK